MAKLMPIADFVAGLKAAAKRKDGYIMGATGQCPAKWGVGSWWFNQYKGKQKDKALYWRQHAKRVWDCNGLAEGLYKDYTCADINTRARYNYANWCELKGNGMIPAKYRKPGMAIFWGTSAASIHHVAYLVEPVVAGKPDGDWYIIEARGVMYGVVQTRLYQRKPNFWGRMSKYFDYGAAVADVETETYKLGERLLKNGAEGKDVEVLQQALITLGNDCGSWGADGDFGDATEMAVRAFQEDNGLEVDGIVGKETVAAINEALEALKDDAEIQRSVKITGKCWVRSAPNKDGNALGVVKIGTVLPYGGQESDGWLLVAYEGQNGWVSGKYGRVTE